MASKQQIRQKFNQINLVRLNQNVSLSAQVNELLSFMEYIIKKEYEGFTFPFSICGGGRRTYKVTPQFESSFSACGLAERVDYFEAAVNYMVELAKQTSIKPLQQDIQIEEISIKIIKGIKIKQPCKISVKKSNLDCKNYQMDLTTYLLRKSKKEPKIYLFQTITNQEPTIIRFQIVDYSTLRANALIEFGKKTLKQYIQKLIKTQKNSKPSKIVLKKHPNFREPKLIDQGQNLLIATPTQKQINSEIKVVANENLNNKSVIEQLLEDNQDTFKQQIYEYLQRRDQQTSSYRSKSKTQKLHKNQLDILLPHFNIQNLDAFTDFVLKQKHQKKRMFIYYSQRYNSYKLQLILNCQSQKLLTQLCQGQNQKLWNFSINQSQVKWPITSQNAQIIYRKQKAISEWYRQRDFVYIRYLFKKGNCHYLIDRSIQNTHFYTFQSIHRGFIHYCVFRIDPFQEGVKLVIELKMQYGGMLTQDQKMQMTLSYLREYVNLEGFIYNFKKQPKNTYNYNWEIQDTRQLHGNDYSMASIQSDIFDNAVQPIDGGSIGQNNSSFISICEIKPQIQKVEITQEQKKFKRKMTEQYEYQNQQIRLNQDGYSLLPKLFLRIRHPVWPFKSKEQRKKLPYQNIMLKDDFIIDKQGGMLLINQARIAAQNNVIKFIMSTLKKNLFSGKGLLNISLPVQIFNSDSNIQRLCQALSLAPDLIQKRAVTATTPLQRFKHCIAFALSNSVIYFNIDKPFNPILGETFQGIIDGCPVYAEQISHHPPISSILFYGRGYRIHANLQAKVYVHLNSGEGVNEGLYNIQFNDGNRIIFQTAPGEVSGLAVGDRKFRIKGKMIVLDPNNKLCCCVKFEEQTGLFSSKTWKYSDQMQGDIVKVTDSYVRKFFGCDVKDLVGPQKKQIEETLGKISGRWIEKLIIDGQTYYDINWMPYQMIHYQYPLNSNSNYREDLLYRKLNNLARSQQEKERLQVLQRNDKKLREKYHPQKH